MLHMAEGSRVLGMRAVPNGTHAAIQPHGVCPVSARGLPTVTRGLTQLLELNNQQREDYREDSDN